jgi:hypothetical protein
MSYLSLTSILFLMLSISLLIIILLEYRFVDSKKPFRDYCCKLFSFVLMVMGNDLL